MDIVVEARDTVKWYVSAMVNGEVHEPERRKSGGAAAERDAAGGAWSEGGRRRWRCRGV